MGTIIQLVTSPRKRRSYRRNSTEFKRAVVVKFRVEGRLVRLGCEFKREPFRLSIAKKKLDK